MIEENCDRKNQLVLFQEFSSAAVLFFHFAFRYKIPFILFHSFFLIFISSESFDEVFSFMLFVGSKDGEFKYKNQKPEGLQIKVYFSLIAFPLPFAPSFQVSYEVPQDLAGRSHNTYYYYYCCKERKHKAQRHCAKPYFNIRLQIRTEVQSLNQIYVVNWNLIFQSQFHK